MPLPISFLPGSNTRRKAPGTPSVTSTKSSPCIGRAISGTIDEVLHGRTAGGSDVVEVIERRRVASIGTRSRGSIGSRPRHGTPQTALRRRWAAQVRL